MFIAATFYITHDFVFEYMSNSHLNSLIVFYYFCYFFSLFVVYYTISLAVQLFSLTITGT